MRGAPLFRLVLPCIWLGSANANNLLGGISVDDTITALFFGFTQ